MNKSHLKTATIFFAFLLTNICFYSQNYKDMFVFKKDNTTKNISGTFVYEDNLVSGISIKNANGKRSFLKLGDVNKIKVDKKTVVPKVYKSNTYLFFEILKGKLSLYKDKNNYYLEDSINGLKQIPTKENARKNIFKPGFVSVFINKCNSAVNKLQNKAAYLSLNSLKDIISTYNTCNLSSEIQFSNAVILESLKPNEKVNFGVSTGLLNLNNNYQNIVAINNNNLTLFSVGAKFYFITNLLKKNNLNFTIQADYFFEGQQNFENTDVTFFSQTQFFKISLAANYKFTSLKSNIIPYAGFAGNMFFNSASQVTLLSKPSNNIILNNTLNNILNYSLHVGAIVKVLGQKFDILLAYQPTTNTTFLNTSFSDSSRNSYDFSSLNFNLTYIF